MKRFTETTKWDSEWFQDLPLVAKCLWSCLLDRCDSAGVYEPNWRLASFQLGEPVVAANLKAFGDRVELLPNGKIWLRGFVEFQHGKLSPDCKPHVAVIRLLEKHGLDERFPELAERVNKGNAKGKLTLEGKDKDKGKEEGKVSAEGGQGETPPAAVQPASPPPADDPERELTADEIVAVIQRIYGSPRKPSAEALHAVADAMPVKAREGAELEHFYAARADPKNPSMARCLTPSKLCLQLGDQLGKARTYCQSPAGRQRVGRSGSAPPPSTAVTTADINAFIDAHPEYSSARGKWPGYDQMPHFAKGDFDRWRRSPPLPAAA